MLYFQYLSAFTLTGRIFCGQCKTTFRRKQWRGVCRWSCRAHSENTLICATLPLEEKTIQNAFCRLYYKLKHHGGPIFSQKYRELTWNDLHEHSMICVASIDKGAAIPILRLLKEQHLLCCYRQLECDDSSFQWLQEVAKSEKQDVAMFWNPNVQEQQKSSDWFRKHIKSIKSPILVQFNDVNIFTPEGTKHIVFLSYGEDIEKIAESIRK